MATDPDDPFAPRSDDRTIMVPTPRRPQSKAPDTPAPRPAAPPPAAHAPAAAVDLPDAVGANPLLAAATPILDLIPQLRGSVQADPNAVKSSLIAGIRSFEQSARKANLAPEKIVAARYALCTFVDETAANTPWGGSGQWSAQSLLVSFHNEAWGGEKTFQLLAKLAENPGANRDLLELLEVCLAMGFQGRFRVVDNGQAQLLQVRERLFEVLRRERGDVERELSPNWKGAAFGQNAIISLFPLWVVAAATALILTLTFVILSTVLNRKSDPVFASVLGIQAPQAEGRVAAPAQKPVPPRLRGLLAEDIAAQYVDVGDYDDRSVVTIRSDGFFAPASNTVPDKMVPLIDRIAEAINQVPGKVLVIGHSDNAPIRSVRFPSNWHLSTARAETVAQRMARIVDPARIRSEGRAESEPIAPNDTPANRAKNRRVEVQVLVD
ncbi:DotU family type VI secretion system protein [Panacagrimonas sp.]|uniref:DotU family type VI secretion system protein n=1 Tax=Panacagrimonas sp. TaxID=2480088 RepID=UPI003B5208CE